MASLNAFHRYAYIQLLESRKRDEQAQMRQQEQIAAQQLQQAQIAQQVFASATSSSGHSSVTAASPDMSPPFPSGTHSRSLGGAPSRPPTNPQLPPPLTTTVSMGSQAPPPASSRSSKRETGNGFTSHLMNGVGLNRTASTSRLKNGSLSQPSAPLF